MHEVADIDDIARALRGSFPFRSTAPHPMDFHTYTLNLYEQQPAFLAD